MEQITEFFNNINWVDVGAVATEYITKINIKPPVEALFELFMSVVGVILGGLGISF